MVSGEELVRRMRESGKAYLRKHPKAFGGGIDPETGIRYVEGKRVSVTTPKEEKAGIKILTLAGAREISKPTPTPRPRPKISPLALPRRPSPLSKYVPLNTPKTGIGAFTRAVDVGEGKMQDVIFRYSNGRITQRTPIGKKFPQTKRFKEREERERLKVAKKPVLLKQSIAPIPSWKSVKKGTVSFLDIVSGGYLTERSLDKKQEQINKDIESFNKKFGGKELSESEYKKALQLSKSIGTRENLLTKEKDKLASSKKSKIYGTLFKTLEGRRLTSKELAEKIKRSQPEIKKLETRIKKTDKQIAKEFKGKGVLSKLNIKRLKAVKSGALERIQNLKTGTSPKIHAGEFPIIPAVSIPSGVTTVKFLGTQKKAKGGKVITDIIFKTSRGDVGIAKGVSVTKGKRGASIVLGRSGKINFRLPSGKMKLTDIKSFIGREKTITIPSKIAVRTQLDLLAKGKKIGTLTKVKKNINILKQAGIGQVGVVKGKKLMRVGKAVRGISIDDFASISAILTKKELSLIIGKSVTGVGAKSRFIGLIKGAKKGKIFSVGEKQQFQKGLQKVISVTASALAKAEKTGKLPRATALATASRMLIAEAKKPKPKPKPITKIKAKPKPKPVIPKPITKPKPKIKPKPITKPRRKAKAKPKPVTPKPITKPKKKPKKAKVKRIGIIKPKLVRISPAGRKIREQQIKIRTRLEARQKSLTEQLSKQRQKVKQLSKQKQTAKQKQAQKKVSKLAKKQKQLAKQIKKVKAKTIPMRVPRLAIPPKPKKKIIKKPIKRKKPVRKQAYNVYARPIKKRKGKRRPKLVKVNKVPLRKKRAKDVRNYIVDTSLSGTGRIRKTKGKPRGSRLKVPIGYAKRTSKKFRRYKKVKGKRKLLPKGKVIERKRKRLDTRGEKNQISLRRRIKQITKPRKRRRTQRPTPRSPVKTRRRNNRQKVTGAKRTQMLNNLAKARKVRMSNLKKKKR